MAIRITHGWQVQRNIRQVSGVRSGIAELQQQAFTGKRLHKASDSPTDWSNVETLRSHQKDQSTYATNADRAYGVLTAADRTLGSASDIMKRVRELAVGAASEAAVDEYHTAARLEITALREQLTAAANGEFAGRYLFAGTAYDEPPFDAAGTYTGTTDEPSVTIGRDNTVLQGVDGSTVFKGPIDVFQVMDDLDAALAAEDADAVFDLLDDISGSHEQIVDARSRVGVQQRRTEDLQVLAQEMDGMLNQLVSEKVDADAIGIYTQISAMQSTYEATLQISAGTFQRNLFQLL